MYQTYIGKLYDPSDNTRGFRGLLARASVHNREDRKEIANKGEARAGFRQFSLVMDLTGTQQKKFVQFNKEVF